jgi:hypothetical protein
MSTSHHSPVHFDKPACLARLGPLRRIAPFTLARGRSVGVQLLVAASILVLSGCGGGGGGADGSAGPPPAGSASNQARFGFDCDLNGVIGVLTMEIEIIANTGITWGSGPTPDITGVISAGSNTILTSGTVVSPSASYTFMGRDNFADFREGQTNATFLVQWSSTPTVLLMIVNPFGPGPATHDCQLRTAVRL